MRDLPAAVEWEGYSSVLRHVSAKEDERITLGLGLDSCQWELQLAVDGGGIHPYHGELFSDEGELLFDRPVFQRTTEFKGTPKTIDKQSFLRFVYHIEDSPRLSSFIEFLTSIRIYGTYWLNKVREIETGQGKSDFLHPTGKNLFTVLRNWKSAPRAYGNRFSWVLDALKDAFPDQVEDLEFDMVGEAVYARLYPPNALGPDVSLPIGVAADGFLTGLLHLTAVAGAEPNSVLAFDEMENQLHPHAIRSILASMRKRAEEQELTIILTTHSPVLMNEFKGYEEQFFVMQPGGSPLPQALNELKDPEWLAHFSLGDLYEREDFGAPLDLEK